MSRILIVEDEIAIADLEKDYLELSGFEVEVENDGMTGLARALAEEFDCSRDKVARLIPRLQNQLFKKIE